MKAVLDHIGIAVKDLSAALAFYRDALGLEIEAPEEVASQQVRAHFVPVGQSKLELLEPTGAESAIAKYVEKRGPGLHHITLRVDDIEAAVAQVKSRGVRMIDERPRLGAEGSTIAFIHPSSAHGVLIELKQSAIANQSAIRPSRASGRPEPVEGRNQQSAIARFTLGDLELISLSDGFFRMDGGLMFGVVPKVLWSERVPPDDRNRVPLALRPLIVRGARTMIIDAGLGDKENDAFRESLGVDRRYNLDHALADARLAPEDIDIVLASHLHFDHAGGFTVRDAAGRLRPRFPRAQYIVRRGEWEDATHVHSQNRARYLADDYLPLAEAGVLQLVDEDVTIMPGVKVRRTGGHSMHHQMVIVESGGKTAAFVADLIPTVAHVSDGWTPSLDLYPVDTLAAKQAFVKEAVAKEILVFFEHDPVTVAGYIREENGQRRVIPALG
jgi:methylmalonyl-CoA epimerase